MLFQQLINKVKHFLIINRVYKFNNLFLVFFHISTLLFRGNYIIQEYKLLGNIKIFPTTYPLLESHYSNCTIFDCNFFAYYHIIHNRKSTDADLDFYISNKKKAVSNQENKGIKLGTFRVKSGIKPHYINVFKGVSIGTVNYIIYIALIF